jgi:hypothetical protein
MVNVGTIRCDWSTRGLHWPSPEVLVDAASGRGDNYSMPDLAHDTRQIRMFRCPVGMHNHASVGRSEWALLY